MGLILGILNALFGSGTNVVKETAEVFTENAEAASVRGAGLQEAALNQFAAEFAFVQKSGFDRFMDGVNRVPRPALAMGTLFLFVTAMVDPIWFAARMQGLAVVPEPLWWLLGIIVAFYFGARHQTKSFQFHKAVAATLANAPVVARNIEMLEALRGRTQAGGAPETPVEAAVRDNPALVDWRKSHG